MNFTEFITKPFKKSEPSKPNPADDFASRKTSVEEQIRVLEVTKEKAPSAFTVDDANLLERKKARLIELEEAWNQNTNPQNVTEPKSEESQKASKQKAA